jgi:hypothetical protein
MAVDTPETTSHDVLAEADHPVIFVLAMLMVVIAGTALVAWLGSNLNLPGLVAITRK